MVGLDEEAIFQLARQIDRPDTRLAYLDQACGADVGLRARLDALMRAYEERSFLERPVVCPPALGPDTVTRPPDAPTHPSDAGSEVVARQVIAGRYKLLQQIGEGGMGTVWMAEQTEPVHRRVALKLIKAGMDSRQVVARFEAERQALALMDHPNIARVFDGGTTDAGRPYFVMELVNGVPITQYCDHARLTPRERLELFVPVCQALQHAHQKGVIHRDVKPSNVLVAPVDGRPVAKVIDFGVAKAVDQRLTDKTLFTQFGGVVGTLQYMSPEQAAAGPIGVDTRTDVYSLGVLLYELLTGTTPIDQKRIQQDGIAEVLRRIKEEEPPRPSTRLCDSGGTLASIAAVRQTQPARLTQIVRGELDWIVMKCLEKDRARRYESAGAFAADVQRYLADEPVLACPPSAGYRLRKFARRNARTLGTASGLAAAMLVVAGTLGWHLSDRSSRRAATAARVEQALAESDTLFRNRKLPEAVVVAQSTLATIHPGDAPELRRRIDDRVRALEFATRLEEARLLGASITEDSKYDHEATAAAYSLVFEELGVPVESLDAATAAERVRQSYLRDQLITTLDNWANMRTVSEQKKGHLLAVVVAADDDPWRREVRATADRDVRRLIDLANRAEADKLAPAALTLLATYLHRVNETDAAARLLRKAQQVHPADFWINQNLATYLARANSPDPDESLRFQTVAVALRPQSPLAHFWLGTLLGRKGKTSEALACLDESVRLRPDFSHGHFARARLYLFPLKDYPAAVAAFSKGLEYNPTSAEGLSGRSGAYRELGEWEKSLADSSQAVKQEPGRASAWVGLAEALRGLGRKGDAVAAYGEAVKLLPTYVMAMRRRAELLAELGQHDLSAADLARAAELDPAGQLARFNEAERLRGRREWDKAIAELTRLITTDRTKAAYWHSRGLAHRDSGQAAKAIDDLSKAIELKFAGAPILLERGELYAAQNDWELALTDYSKAAELEATLPAAWYHRGTALAALDRTKEALTAFSRASQLSPKDRSLQAEIAHAHRGLRQWDLAIDGFSRLIEQQPDHAEFLVGRGQTYDQMGQPDKAVADFSRAIKCEPKSPLAWSERGQSHAELGRWREAARDYGVAALLDPDNVSSWDFSATAHLGAADGTAYRTTCSEMLEHFGATRDGGTAGRLVGACVLGPLDPRSAEKVLALAESACRQDAEWAIGFRGAALVRTGKPAEALDCFRKKAEHHTPRAWDLLFAAIAHHHLGQAEKADTLRTQAEQWMARAGKFNTQRDSAAETDWESWQEPLTAKLLHAELVGLQKATGEKKK